MQALKHQGFVGQSFWVFLKKYFNELLFLVKAKLLETFDYVYDCHTKQQVNEICFEKVNVRGSNSRHFFIFQKNCVCFARVHIRCVALQYSPFVVLSNRVINY